MDEKNDLKLSAFLENRLQDLVQVTTPRSVKSKKVKKIAEAVLALSDAYVFKETGIPAQDKMPAALTRAYAAYFMPANLVKLFPLLDEINKDPELRLFQRESLSVLDIGCGPGTFTLGVLEYLSQGGACGDFSVNRVRLALMDRSGENLALAHKLVTDYLDQGPVSRRVRGKSFLKKASLTADASLTAAFSPNDGYDLIVAGNVLAELSEADISLFSEFLEKRLLPEGVIVVIDPGTRRSFQRLMVLRDRLLEAGLKQFAPCPNSGICPLTKNSKNWCHENLSWQPPELVQTVDRIIGFSKEKGLRFAYLTFTRKDSKLSGLYPALAPDRVFRVVSYRIKNKGEERLYVCNGRDRIMLRRLKKNSSDQNADFGSVQRGDCVWFDRVMKKKAFFDVGRESLFEKL